MRLLGIACIFLCIAGVECFPSLEKWIKPDIPENLETLCLVAVSVNFAVVLIVGLMLTLKG